MRIAVLSLHTSPAAQPGQGDAGGLNVYVLATAAQLAQAGHEVEIFTADPVSSRQPRGGTEELAPGIRLHHLVHSAPDKSALAGELDGLSAEIAAHPALPGCAFVWAHYWISAAVGLRLASHGHRLPVAVSFHTIGAVKDRDAGEALEPAVRLAAERDIAARADLLIANTPAEASDMQALLEAAPARIVLAPPGVDRNVFTPGPIQDARRRVGEEAADLLVLYVGRMQRIKGTDSAIRALAALRRLDPVLAGRTRLVMLGAASGEDTDRAAIDSLIAAGGVGSMVEILPPVPAAELADWYRAADLVLVPSRSESFGFAAAEAAACGVPVLASAVGGLAHVVRAGDTGVLVAGEDPLLWAEGMERLLLDPALRARMGGRARARAQEFDWAACVDTVLAAMGRRWNERTENDDERVG